MDRLSTVTDLGDVVRAARRAHGWTQQHTADLAGVSRRFVNMIEGGRHANAEVGRVLALLDALELRLSAHAPGALPDTGPALDGHGLTHVPVNSADIANTAVDGGEDDDIDLDAYLATFRDRDWDATP